jgi:triacylglycerol lipase
MRAVIRKMIVVGILIFGLAVMKSWVANAQNDLQSASEVIRNQRKIYIQKIMVLTPREQEAFRLLYAEYESGLSKIKGKRIELAMNIVQNHGILSDTEAIVMLKQKLRIDAIELKFKLSYLSQFMQVLPGRKVARFYQAENRFDTAAISELYRNIPLIQSEAQPVSQSGKKEIPKITLKNLSPPYLDYDYFRHSKKYVFQFNATSFNLINTWWLAEASTLVYANQNFVRSQFRKAGLPKVKFFDNQSTQCFVANNDKFAIVAFRGSDIWNKNEKFDLKKVVADLKTDVDIWLTNWQQGGKVHRGFKEALEEVWPDLLPYIRKLHNKGCKIWITGHSLGAALATLSAGLYGSAQGVYTFGSPRVGNEVFKENFDVKIYRIVNNDDIVPRLPPPGKYFHVGELKFIDSNGIIQETMIENEGPVDQPRDKPYDSVNTNQTKKSTFAEFIPASFRDHVPLLYSIHIWNNIIKNQQ